MITTYYRFTDGDLARVVHAAIDDARLGGTDRHWPDAVTERHTSLTRDGSDWLIKATGFTETQRGTAADPGPMWPDLPEPVAVDFGLRTVERINPRRTDVLASRRG